MKEKEIIEQLQAEKKGNQLMIEALEKELSILKERINNIPEHKHVSLGFYRARFMGK